MAVFCVGLAWISRSRSHDVFICLLTVSRAARTGSENSRFVRESAPTAACR